MLFRCTRIAWKVAGVGALVMSFGLFAATARAGVKPGDVITPQNASQVKDLVSPGVYYMVTHGMHMDIVPTERIDWPPPYKDATEKYSSQVRLTDDHRSLVGYVAGQPFPLIDTNDPQVGDQDHVEQRVPSDQHRRLRPALFRLPDRVRQSGP